MRRLTGDADELKPSTTQDVFRILLALFLLFAGVGHLTFARAAFQAQVPDFVPLAKDLTVVLSGVVEIIAALSLMFLERYRIQLGVFLAILFVLVFPGNVAQYVHHRSAFGLDTDGKRLARLFVQPVLIAWALWCTGAWAAYRQRQRSSAT